MRKELRTTCEHEVCNRTFTGDMTPEEMQQILDCLFESDEIELTIDGWRVKC